MLKIENLSFSYNKSRILKALSLDVGDREIIALLGPSGSGKSTLFNLITKQINGFEGQILYRGEKIEKLKKLPFSYMTQEPYLLPWKTALENINFACRLSKTTLSSSSIESLLMQFGIMPYFHLYPHQLSLGTKQRFSLARALLTAGDLLLLDEPFAALDKPTRIEMYKIFHGFFHKMSFSTLFITHQLEEAKQLATKILYLSNGQLVSL